MPLRHICGIVAPFPPGASAGPLLSPNEHRNRAGVIQVPWFTTGVGAWLYALNALFVQVDEEGTRLLPAVPDSLAAVRFRDLRAELGVLVSGELHAGRLVRLTARASQPLRWRYRIPACYAGQQPVLGEIVRREADWWWVERAPIGTGDTSLIPATG